MSEQLLSNPCNRENIVATVMTIADRLMDMNEHILEEHVFPIASEEAISRLREIGIPANGRPLQEVVDEMTSEIYPHRSRLNHPRCFAFIPSPVSPLSQIGDFLTATHNAHAGSWFTASGPSCIEQELIAWLCSKLWLPPSAGGLFVSGGSMANLTALTIARDRMLQEDARASGIAYVSEQTHSSVAKGLKIIGFLDRQIRKVPVDENFRMDVEQLTKWIARDRAAGLTPFLVVASAGTTNTGSIDPLHAIGKLCATERLWMHVDGAFGASVALSKKHHELLSGIEYADSVSWDAHKWLFQTYGCGMILVRNRQHLLDSYNTRPEYLRDAESEDNTINFWDFGPELTRPARSLKLWLTLQVLGSNAIGETIDHGFQLAEWAQDELRKLPDWRIVSPAQLAIVNFRYTPPGFSEETLDAMNAGISRRSLSEGFAGVLTTRLNGRTVLRICALHPAATEQDMRATVIRLNDHAHEELRATTARKTVHDHRGPYLAG